METKTFGVIFVTMNADSKRVYHVVSIEFIHHQCKGDVHALTHFIEGIVEIALQVTSCKYFRKIWKNEMVWKAEFFTETRISIVRKVQKL